MLEVLDVSECRRVTEDSVENWRKQRNGTLDVVFQRLPRLFAKQEAEQKALQELTKRQRMKRHQETGQLALVDEKGDLVD